jgi:hypothetical protein
MGMLEKVKVDRVSSLALHKTLLRLSRLLYRAELPEVRIF